MVERVRSGLSYANVMATVAVFLALGGGAYALSGVPDRAGVFHGCASNRTGGLRLVKSTRSCHKAVRRGKHRDPGEFAVAWNQRGPQGAPGNLLADGAITTAKLADGSVTSAKFAPRAKAPDSAALGAQGPTAYGAVLSGRMNNVGTSGLAFGAASGTSTASPGPPFDGSNVATLSPNANLVARDLSVRLTAAPGTLGGGGNNSRFINLVINGTITNFSCTVTNPATTCTTAGNSIAVPANSALAIIEDPFGSAPQADALFAFRLTPQ